MLVAITGPATNRDAQTSGKGDGCLRSKTTRLSRPKQVFINCLQLLCECLPGKQNITDVWANLAIRLSVRAGMICFFPQR